VFELSDNNWGSANEGGATPIRSKLEAQKADSGKLGSWGGGSRLKITSSGQLLLHSVALGY